MSTLSQLREGLSKAWDSITIGWGELRDLASDALTRFHAKPTADDRDPEENQVLIGAARWSVLAAEVIDQGDNVKVMLEAPGLEPKDIDVEVMDDVLVVRGEKKVSREETKGRYHIMERAYGHFERAIRLPVAVEHDGANAKYKSGVLSVTLRKSEPSGGRRIPVISH